MPFPGRNLRRGIANIEDAKKAWIDVALQDGETIPEPTKGLDEYSGKLNIRIPKSLHRTLAEKAREEKVSLNQYISYQLARGVGHPVKK